jgi:REP element-mobilizing transposase RayT
VARKPRIEFPGALYHVITRGNNKQKTFLGENDYRHFLERLKFYKDRFDFTLYSYVLMPNHIHLLIETSDIPLSQIMQPLALSYTQYFNLAHDRVGHLFQGRYKAILCQRDAYLKELVRYINLNPIRAGLVKDLDDWQWCSHHEILRRDGSHVTSIKALLPLFGKNACRADTNLREFLKDGMAEGHKEEYYLLKDHRVLGDEDFAEEAVQREPKEPGHFDVTIEDVIGIVSKHSGIGSDEIVSAARRRRGARARGIAAYIAKNMCGLTSKEISRYFKRSDAMISRLISSISIDKGNDKELDDLLSGIEKQIRQVHRPVMFRMPAKNSVSKEGQTK